MNKRDVVARRCMATAVLWTCCLTSSVVALAIPPNAPRIKWDFTDPVNIAETRAYAALWFDFKDTGVISEELSKFRFTNTPPLKRRMIFIQSELLMEELYAHRLNPYMDHPEYYTIYDLLRDDPEAEAAFRRYVTTGLFSTPWNGDADLLTNHLAAIANAMGTANTFQMLPDGAVVTADRAIESYGLTLTRK